MESFICKKCSNKYDDSDRLPLVVGCGHTLCKECYIANTLMDTNKIKCPFDEKEFALPNDLPVNQIIVELLMLNLNKV
jgi:hypothetical protein